MRRRFRRLTYAFLNLRYIVLLSSILLFLIIGTAILLVYQNTGVMREQINWDFNQQQMVLARQAAHQIEANLSDIRTDLLNLRQLLSKLPQADWEEVLHATAERGRSRGVIEIGVADSKTNTLKSHSAGLQEARLAPEVLGDCRYQTDGRAALGTLRVSETDGASEVTSTICCRMHTSTQNGDILFARLDVSKLIGGVMIHIHSGKTGYAWAVNQEGVFLYHPEEEFVAKNAFTARREREPKISFKQINRIMKEQMLRGEEGTGTYVSGWHGGIEGDITKQIAFSPVKSPLLTPGRTWSVAVAAPTSEVAEPVDRMYRRNLVTVAALFVGLFVFGILVAIYQNRMSQTLRKRVRETEEDLHEMERIYYRMVEQATDLIYVFDLDMRFVILNQQTVDMFVDLLMTEEEGLEVPNGMEKTQIDFWKGKRLDKLMREFDAVFVRKKMDEVLKKNQSIAFEHVIKHKDRQSRLSTKLIPIRDDKRRVHYILGISRDMTERLEMDQRIYSAEKLASIGILASGVAHEINNPLAIILGFTDLLLERVPKDSQEYEDLKLIEQNAMHAKGVVENMLGFARITEGLEETVNPNNSVDIVMKIVRNTLMTKKVKLVTQIPDDLPMVRGDTREFQQVIFNLINNSVAAMTAREDGSGKLTVSAQADNDWVHVSIADNGIGIPNRIKPQIFDPFFTTKKTGEGTGLGLSLCYGILKKYGGKISFSSVSAEDHPDWPTGTTFVVSMPIARAEKE
ncbi:MAG: PAS domain-containing protein [Candidatus Latescibacterota bacterium]|nr:MAG: PAS domain-containing protein [Candidatus Latescibacterota bacterium]